MPLPFTPHPATPRILVSTVERASVRRLYSPILLLTALLLSSVIQAQRCLEISILGLMGQHLHVPGDPASNFSLCTTTINENGQVVITSYGQDLADMDSMAMRTERKFNVAVSQATMTSKQPSERSVENSQELARKLQAMTPEQQKAWAMKYATQQMQDQQPQPVAEDPNMAKLVGDVNGLFVQISQLNSAFSANYLALSEAEGAELDKVPAPDGSGCTGVDKVGEPSCSCINGVYGKHFQSMLDIEKKYDAQKIELLSRTITQSKAIVTQAEADISALRNGDALNSPAFKKQLLSYQAGIFSGAFAQTGSAIEQIRKESSDIYVNKANCDKKKYQLWCE